MKNLPRSSIYLVAVLGFSALANLANAAPDEPMSPNTSMMPKDNLKRADKTFFEKAATSGMDEVAISTGALDRITSPQVKDFAQMMVTDHTAVNTELTTLASSKGVMLPPKDKSVMSMTEKWSKKTKGVDADYMDKMISDHKDAVELFTKASKSDDAQIAAFAQKTLPSLQHHLDMAKSLKASMK